MAYFVLLLFVVRCLSMRIYGEVPTFCTQAKSVHWVLSICVRARECGGKKTSFGGRPGKWLRCVD